MESTTTQNDIPKCKTCKNFFANSQFSGQCSKCYKESQNCIPQPTEIRQSAVFEKIEVQPEAHIHKEPQRPEQKDKKRCFNCNKKTGLLGIQCKCGYVFCNAHRLPEEHKCIHNHKKQGEDKLKQKLAKITKGKIEQF